MQSHDEFEARHSAEHPEPVDGCFACKLGTVQLSAAMHAPRATRFVPPRTPDNAWERGVSGTDRPDGSFMPYVKEDLSPISVKQFANKRGHYTDQIKNRKAASAAGK